MKYFYHFLSRLQLRWNICIATKFSLKADVQIFARKRVISRKKYVAVEYVNFYKREREFADILRIKLCFERRRL